MKNNGHDLDRVKAKAKCVKVILAVDTETHQIALFDFEKKAFIEHPAIHAACKLFMTRLEMLAKEGFTPVSATRHFDHDAGVVLVS